MEKIKYNQKKQMKIMLNKIEEKWSDKLDTEKQMVPYERRSINDYSQIKEIIRTKYKIQQAIDW